MSSDTFWDLFEVAANWFYDPVVFWSLPLVIALARELLVSAARRHGS